MLLQTSSEFFFNFRFSTRTPQSLQRLAKKIIHFTIQFRSKNLTQFTNLNSLEFTNEFTNFLAYMDLFDVRKDIYTAPFHDVQELHS